MNKPKKPQKVENDFGHLRRFYESGLIALFYWNINGQITDANDKFLDMVGYTRDDLTGGRVDWVQMTPPEYRHLDEASRAELKAAGINKTPYEKEYVRKDGTRIPVIVASALLDEKRNTGVAYVLDITERKRAEKVLKESEDRYRVLMENMPDGVVVHVQGRIVFANTASAILIGAAGPADLVGRPVIEFVHPDCRELALKRIRRSLSEGVPAPPAEEKLIRLDGRVIDVEVNAIPLIYAGQSSVLTVVNDITERKQAEKLQDAIYRIAQAADRAGSLNALYPAIHAIVQEVMVADNFYIALYDEKNDLLSFPFSADKVDPHFPPRKPGKGMTEYVLRAGRSVLRDEALFEELIRCGEIELVGVHSTVWLGVPLIIEGKTIGIMAVQDYEDPRAYGERERRILEFVSSQAAMAIHRKKAEDQVRQSLREKEILLREIYHRTKNNMNVITAMLSLRAENCGDEALARTFKDIENRIKAMSLVHQKLYESQDLSRIDIRDYLTDLASLLIKTGGPSAGRIVLENEAEPLRLPIDTAIPLGMVVTELFSNVFKHALAEGAEVRVRLRLARSEPGEIELTFSDDGVGTPPGFDFRNSRTLGLQTVFMLVEHQLRGRCDFEGGRGVSCRIRVPEPAVAAAVRVR